MAAVSTSFFPRERINSFQALDLAGTVPCKKAPSDSNRLSDRSFGEESIPSEIISPQQIEAIKTHLPPRLFSLILPKILRGEMQVDAPRCMFFENKPAMNLNTRETWVSVELVHYGIGPNRITWCKGHAVGSQGLTKYLKSPLEPREITAIFARCMGFLLQEKKLCSQASLLKSLLKTLGQNDPRLDWEKIGHDCTRFLTPIFHRSQAWVVLSPEMLRHNPYWTDLSAHSHRSD